ncbi:hypothetical protein DPEC_G00185110 [Dallia pectoralis]|uniref:Uncharacterized protein n=1 Tax=Dallia pectoralis TaxID=75939 RepID=A0ACC2GBF3_DALPE|nr:hypothetical protein DPEC_G00185110 [Dallia pectoralis]
MEWKRTFGKWCPPCQSKRAPIKEKTQYNPIVVSEPLELVGMDLVGKLTLTDGGNQYICVMVDYFTKWAEAYPLKSKTAVEVNYGLCQTLGNKRSLCSPYHPQTNGLVEKLNGIIQRSLNKVVADHPKDWDQYLQETMFALQTKKQLTTKYSPYFLMFGREARYPSEVDEEYEVTDDKVNRLLCLEEISEGAHKRQSVYEDVKHNVKKSQDAVCHQGHWTLIINLKEKRSLFVDPFGATQKQIEQCRDVTRALVRKHYPAIGK